MGFLFKILKPDDPYYRNWLEYRAGFRKKWLAIALFPVTGFVSMLLCATAGRFEAAIVPIAMHFAIIFALAWKAVALKCPRCGRRFRSWLFAGFLLDKCGHCGLREHAPTDLS